jgi:TPR repeat protein
MIKFFIYYLLTLFGLFISIQVSAQEESSIILEIPNKSELVSLNRLENYQFVGIKTKIKKNTLRIAPGTYKYKLTINSSSKEFEGQFTVTPKMQNFYIHTYVSPDRKIIYVFPSANAKNTPEYDMDILQVRCRLIHSNNFYIDNSEDALRACQLWAEAGSAEANRHLGYISKNGKLGKVDIQKALEYFKKAYASGDMLAGVQLVIIYSEKEDHKNELDVAKSMALKNDPAGQSFFAYMLANGIETQKDIAQAKSLALKSVAQGYTYSFKILSLLPTSANSEKPDLVEAMTWAIIYLKSSNFEDFRFFNYYETINSELSSDQLTTARQRADKLIASDYQQYYQGKLCIAPKDKLNPEFKSKNIQYKVNQYDELFDLASEGPTKVEYLSSNKENNEISFYVDGNFDFSKSFFLDNESLTYKCIYFDKSIESHDIGDLNASTDCSCFTK